MILTPILPTLISGQMTTLACPATADSRCTFLAATLGLIAESNWNSPSMARSGRRSLAISRARRTLSTSSLSIEPSVECESSAQRISHPVSERTVSLDEIAIEASSSLVGSTQTAESPKAKRPPSPPVQLGISAMPQELTVSTPSARPTIVCPARIISPVALSMPANITSTSPSTCKIRARSSGRVIRRAAPLGLNLQSGCER